MKYSTTSMLVAFAGLTSAVPFQKREVPQEHSHQEVVDRVGVSLRLDNPNNIQDPIFGLLGDAAAVKGAGDIKNLDCLQRSIADQAFTNEKKAGNVDGMANALIFAALEKNTGAVGRASNTCKEKAVNPEIDAISQHQDPAGAGAQEANKKIVLALAVQLKIIGADPQLAAISATFAPGKADDQTGAGNTCDDLDDKKGCIFTKKLIQVEATPDEIDAAVQGSGAKGVRSLTNQEDVKGNSAAGKGATKAATKSVKADQSDANKESGEGEDAVNNNGAGKANAAKAEAGEELEEGADAAEEKEAGKADAAKANDHKKAGAEAIAAHEKEAAKAKAEAGEELEEGADAAEEKEAGKADAAKANDHKKAGAEEIAAHGEEAAKAKAKAGEELEEGADAAEEKEAGKADAAKANEHKKAGAEAIAAHGEEAAKAKAKAGEELEEGADAAEEKEAGKADAAKANEHKKAGAEAIAAHEKKAG